MRRNQTARVYRVSELVRRVKQKLESWGEVWVEGELSDVSRSASGHLYLTLDDGLEASQLRAVMFQRDARLARAEMAPGARVKLLGRLSLYEPRGGFQLIARVALPAGEGDRRAELLKLKKKLAAEGLFAPERKRSLPRYPSVVGLVTSRDGAALHDVIRVASARAPVRLVLSHCQVQGPEAPASILRALKRVSRLPGLDVVILTRGGGASEDLGAFNDENVARAIARCPVPVVSGVGHEIDETLADLVADRRAATPSNAAEIVVPDGAALAHAVETHERQLSRALEVHLGRERLRLERLERRLSDPRRALGGVRHRFSSAAAGLERAVGRILSQRRGSLHSVSEAALGRALSRSLAHERARLHGLSFPIQERALRRSLASERARLTDLSHRLGRLDPRGMLARDRARLDALSHRLSLTATPLAAERRRRLGARETSLRGAVGPRLSSARSRFSELVARLHGLSPLDVLGRGYAIALHEPTGRALLKAGDAKVGDGLRIRLASGELGATVREVREAEDERP